MPFKLADFRSAVRDLARGHLFEVEILFPTIIGSSELTSMLCHSHNLPGRTVSATTDTFFMGNVLKLAHDISYNNWNSRFRIDDNWDDYKKIKAWHELVHGTETNIASFPSQYKSKVIIYTLDVAGNRIIAVELNGCWPQDMAGVPLDTTKRDVAELTVTWAYDYNVFKVL